MSRWHGAYCDDPLVIISDDSCPRCTCCDSAPLLEALARESIAHPAVSVPPDEPPGALGLRWPYGIKYESLSEVGSLETPTDRQATQASADDSSEPKSESAGLGDDARFRSRHSPWSVYPDTLRPDEIRLVTMHPVDDPTMPLHVTLETFSEDACPEYEAISYTWGGEQDNYIRSQPIYVGPYWDVLFQTQNCVDMLRFVRPWRGIRTIWVDALCINQMNTQERSQQVAKMDLIFQNCSKVVMYAGPDLAPLPPRVFPRRRPLHDLGREQQLVATETPSLTAGLGSLLRRRYFSRVWVVQELLRSRLVVIHVDGIEYWADSRDSTELSRGIGWDKTAAPWFQHVASGHSFGFGSILEGLELTANSRAQDPRDKLFAVAGLLWYRGRERKTLQPDYSLSLQHVFIGFFAYCIIDLEAVHLLIHARGTADESSLPTWIPAWRTHESWWQTMLTDPLPEDMSIDILGHHVFKIEGSSSIFTFCPGNGHNSVGCFGGAVIDADTGALSVSLICLCRIRTTPTLVHESEPLSVFKIDGSKTTLYVASRHSIDTLVVPGQDQLFVMKGDFCPMTYVVLRGLSKPGRFRFVAALPYIYFSVPRSVAKECRWAWRKDWVKSSRRWEARLSALQRGEADMIHKLREELARPLSSWQCRKTMRVTLQQFTPARVGWDLLRVLCALAVDSRDSTETRGFAVALVLTHPQSCRPRLAGAFIEFPFGEMDEDMRSFYDLNDYTNPHLQWGHRKEAQDPWKPAACYPEGPDAQAAWVIVLKDPLVRVRVLIETLRKWFRKHHADPLATLVMLRETFDAGLEELDALIRSGPAEDHQKAAFSKTFSHELQSDFQLDGTTFRVTIE